MNKFYIGFLLVFSIFFLIHPQITLATAPAVTTVNGRVLVNTGEMVSWTVSGLDVEGGDLLFSANWGDGTAVTTASALSVANTQTSVTLVHTYTAPSTFVINFSVGDGTTTSALMPWTVVVRGNSLNQAPVLDNVNGVVAVNIGADNSWLVRAHDAEDAALNLEVNWGDGSTNTQTTLSTSIAGQVAEKSVNHIYNSVGNFTANFKVTDSNNTTADLNWSVVVSSIAIPPVIDLVNGVVTVTVGANNNWVVRAHDADGKVINYIVEWGDGTANSTSTKTGTVNGQVLSESFPHTYNAVGTYNAKFKITDASNLPAELAWTVNVVSGGGGGGNVPPIVALTKPINGSSFTAPASVELEATATDQDGTVTKVEFLVDNSVVNTDTISPFNFSWTSVGAGNYKLKARATDNNGATTTSTETSITVNNQSTGGGCTSNCGGSGGGGFIPTNPKADTVGISVVEGPIVNSVNVTTVLTYGIDISGIALSNTPDFTGASFFAPSVNKPWELTSGDGYKTVYARFRNNSSGFTDKSTSVQLVTLTGATPRVLGEQCFNVIAFEKAQSKKVNKWLTSVTKGKILNNQDVKNDLWYVDPVTGARYFLPSGLKSFGVMNALSKEISISDLRKIAIGSPLSIFNGDDADADGLPDRLENSIGSNSAKADTDSDGYTDALEFTTGYSLVKGSRAKPIYDLKLSKKLAGYVVKLTETGEIWYVNPKDNKRYFVPETDNAYAILTKLSYKSYENELRELAVGTKLQGVEIVGDFTCGTPRGAKLTNGRRYFVYVAPKPRVAGVKDVKPNICKSIDKNATQKEIDRLQKLLQEPACKVTLPKAGVN
ncbi:MAG: Ig-like domain-containing protein [Patescibacteria group bacterium]|mgnify:CR=1 FL=1